MPDADAAGPDPIEGWTAAQHAIESAHRAVLGAVAAAGVQPHEFAVLRALYRAPDRRLSMGEIAQELNMSSGGVTKLADRMAREGLIDRRAVSADRRVVHAALTERGRDLARAGIRAYDEQTRTLVLDRLTDRDIVDLARIADKLRAGLPEPAACPDSPGGERGADAPGEDAGRTGPTPRRRSTDR